MKRLEKLERSNDQLHKLMDRLQNGIVTLERMVQELKAQPIVVPTTTLRVVEKGDDDAFVQPGRLAKVNGYDVDMDALARDVRKFASS
jgi:hypothetical protein